MGGQVLRIAGQQRIGQRQIAAPGKALFAKVIGYALVAKVVSPAGKFVLYWANYILGLVDSLGSYLLEEDWVHVKFGVTCVLGGVVALKYCEFWEFNIVFSLLQIIKGVVMMKKT